MNRALLASVLVVLLILAGLVSLHVSILALALPVLVYLLVGLWRGPRQLGLEASHSLSAERALTGDEIHVELTVANRGLPVEEVLVEDLLPDGLELVSGDNLHLVSLPHNGSATWSYSLRGRRGYYSLSQVGVSVRDSLNLFPINDVLPTDGQVFILPPTLRLKRISIQPRRTRVYSGTIPARQGGSGVEFFGVREYMIGDSSRSINWHATARHPGSMYSNEFEQERVVDVGIILDGRRLTNEYGQHSIFEHSVLAAAALTDALLNAGNRVGLLSYGNQIVWTLPGYGKLQSERILQDLSRLKVGDSMAFTNIFVPRHLFPAHSQLVLVSPLAVEDREVLMELRLRGYHLLVISPNPVEFESMFMPSTPETRLAKRIVLMQRSVMLQRLRALGIQVVDWNTSEPFEQVARRYLERRPAMVRGGRL